MSGLARADDVADRAVTHGIGRIALGDLLRRSARRLGSKAAIIDDGGTTSFAALDDAANRFANHLIDRGYAPGSKIVTICGNSADYIKAIYGIHKAGMVWVPVNVVLGTPDIRYIVEHSEASLVILDADLEERPTIAEALRAMDPPRLTIGRTFENLLADQSPLEPSIEIGERDLALIIYTSGTTSAPKGVMHCHLAVHAGAMSNIGEWRVGRDDRLLIVLPMFHVAAHCLFTTFMIAGATIVLHKGFDAGAALRAIERERITVFVGLPMMYGAMLDHRDFPMTNLSSLRFCIYSMAPMAKTLLIRLLKEFCPTFALTSGQTEMYPITVMFRPEQQLQRFGNYWGEAAMVNDLAIMDDDGNVLPDGEIGEIVHRGPNVMLGYYKNPEATEEARKFGWHHTGDLGMIDPDGQLLFVDRKKDIIKSGGENVASLKVEEVLLRHPAVASAAVIGVPHPRWQEAVVACVMLKSGARVEEAEIIAHCRQALGGFEVPKSIEFVSEMPMTATSKLRKQELRHRLLNKFESA